MKPEKVEKKAEIEQEQIGEYVGCHKLNDKDNESCVFCDGHQK